MSSGSRWFVECLLAVTIGLIVSVVFSGCGYLSGERYTLLGCAPQLGVCRVFDTYTGTVRLVPLPQTAAEKSEQEVKN